MTVSSTLLWRGVWAGAGLLGLALVLGSASTRTLLGAAAGRLDLLALLAVLPIQLVALGLCALALWRLRPGASLLACLASRWLRDAGGNLLVLAPGLGEIAGARLLVLAGGDSAAAVSASALDVLAETIAQLPFALVALIAVPKLWTLSGAPALPTMSLVALSIIGGVTLLVLGRAGRLESVKALIVRLLQRLKPLRRALAERREGLPAAIVLHLIAWGSGGFQVFFAVKAMGGHLGLGGAFVIESFVYAVRGFLFIVPAGLGVQEASFVAAGLIFGLGAEQSLAISLLLRLRDLVLGAPALMAWPLAELLQRRGESALAVPGPD